MYDLNEILIITRCLDSEHLELCDPNNRAVTSEQHDVTAH